MKNIIINLVKPIAMKIFRMIGLLLFLFIVSLTVGNCLPRKCRKTYKYEYSISSFSIRNFNRKELIWINYYIQQAGITIECRNDFGVDLVFETENTLIANCQPVNYLFMQSAHADCPFDMYYPKENIISIQIFSDRDFCETHPSGTNIVEFFKIYDGAPLYLISFEDYLKYPLPTDGRFYLQFRCVLTTAAIEAGEYEFTFVVELSDERIFEQSIKSVLQ